MYSAKILADSISVIGCRLTTMEVTFPRIVLAEFNTHRMLSRNSASSRAIPVEKMLARVKDDPFIPIYWGKNQRGMQAEEELSENAQRDAEARWLVARDSAISNVERMVELGIHKQIANRMLEPWLWHTCIVSATEWANFFALRCHKDAQPEIRRVAEMMKTLYETSKPTLVRNGDWHLPLVEDLSQLLKSGIFTEDIVKISCGRCARVSYLTHDGKRDPKADIEMCDRLRKSGHMSPLEHAAYAMPTSETVGNFTGWRQYRKTISGEAVFT